MIRSGRHPQSIAHDAVSLHPKRAEKLQEVRRLLRRGRARLTGAKGENLTIPDPLYSLLKDAVRNLALGRSLGLIPEEKELTTQQAGELLGVSRRFLNRLLDAGEMPFRLVGRHRRTKVSDLIDYGKRKADRKAALDKMARNARAAGLYDTSAGIPKGGTPP
jgi:excisionase family DNA binding protein